MTKKEAPHNQLKKGKCLKRHFSQKSIYMTVAVAALAIVFGQYRYEYNFITINFFSLIVLCI